MDLCCPQGAVTHGALTFNTERPWEGSAPALVQPQGGARTQEAGHKVVIHTCSSAEVGMRFSEKVQPETLGQ